MEKYHDPVLLWEVINFLQIKKRDWYLDCNLGDGGHSLEVLRLGGKVLGIDVDPQAIERAEKRFKEAGFTEQDFILRQGNFRDLKQITEQTDIKDQKFSGIYFDLGVSSLQLETPSRGFSFLKSGPLDMRMDPSLQVKALDLVKALNKGELYEIFNKFGEEKFSRQLAEVIVGARELINTTKDLSDLVEEFYAKKGIKRGKIHPSTKIFQALRIAVNDELNALEEALPQALEGLKKDGRIVVISFHSLEDRIAKDCFGQWEDLGFGEILTKKPLEPRFQEVSENPRSRSAKLRVFKKYDKYTKI